MVHAAAAISRLTSTESPRAEPGLDEGLQLGAAQITLNEIADASRMPFGGS
jgi:hypothetical protein